MSCLRSFCRSLHFSRLSLSSRWTAAEDALLLKRYEELGPAWTALSLGIQSRSPTECRRRWLLLSGTLEGLTALERTLVYNEGYEKHDGQLIKIPQERIVAGPFAKMAAAIEPVRFRTQRKRGGWTPQEVMAVREGYEQYGPRWDCIARKLQYRTGTQCRNMMRNRFIAWGHHLAEER